MDIGNKISNILGKIIYFGILFVALVGIYQFIKSGERVSGGAIGILLVGFATIGDFLHISLKSGPYIISALLIVLDGLLISKFFNYPNKFIRVLVYFIAVALVLYALSLLFGWSISI